MGKKSVNDPTRLEIAPRPKTSTLRHLEWRSLILDELSPAAVDSASSALPVMNPPPGPQPSTSNTSKSKKRKHAEPDEDDENSTPTSPLLASTGKKKKRKSRHLAERGEKKEERSHEQQSGLDNEATVRDFVRTTLAQQRGMPPDLIQG